MKEDLPTSIYATVAGTAWAGNESLVTGGMRAEEQKMWRGVRIKCIIVSSLCYVLGIVLFLEHVFMIYLDKTLWFTFLFLFF